MSWAGGNYIVNDMVYSLKRLVPNDKIRIQIYEDLINSLESCDWDCEGYFDSEDPLFLEVLNNQHHEWERDNE